MRRRIRNLMDAISANIEEDFLLKTSDESTEEIVEKVREELGIVGNQGYIRAATQGSIETLEHPEDYQWLPDGYVVLQVNNRFSERIRSWLKENYEVISDIPGFRLTWIRTMLEEARVRLENAEDQDEVDEAYRDYIHWQELEGEEVYEEL